MNWGRTKTILIVLFFIVDSLLLATYLILNRSANQIGAAVIDDTVAALSAQGIHISREVIPAEKFTDYHLEMKNIANDFDSAARRFLGEDLYKISDTEYRSDLGSVTNSGGKIHFQSSRQPVLLDSDSISGKTDRMCEKYLKKMGFDSASYFMYNKLLENGILTFEIMPRYKKYKVEGVSMKIKADDMGILDMEGYWFFTEYADGSSAQKFCSAASVLLEFMYNTDSEGKTVSRIDGCYYIPGKNMGTETVLPLPVYIIVCTDGSVSIFHAENAALILQYP